MEDTWNANEYDDLNSIAIVSFSGEKVSKLLGSGEEFKGQKSIKMLKRIIGSTTDENGIVLDFFAGTGSTGHAVLELNKEDGGNRQFILVTNNENKIAEEVCYPRVKTVITGIRNDGTKYSDGIPANLRYFKTDFVEKNQDGDINREEITKRCDELLMIKEGCYEPLKTAQENLTLYQSNTKILAIIFDRYDEIEDSKYIETFKQIQGDKKLVVYRFSIDGNLDMSLDGLENAKLREIPEEILKIYRQAGKGVSYETLFYF